LDLDRSHAVHDIMPAMPEPQIDPADLGFDAARLARIDRHLDRYVESGLLPGWQLVIARDGEIAHAATSGSRDLEAGLPVEPDTLWRIYSMTKPIVSVAAMSLWEEGAFELKDPIARWLPAFAESRVYRGGSALAPRTEPLTEPIRMWHLLTHTAGLTYGFHHAHPVDAIYREAGFDWTFPPGDDLATCCDTWAALPLQFQPGTRWNYGVSTDVLGRVLEVIAGRPLDAVLRERVTGPLGMHETDFAAPQTEQHRLAALYSPDPLTGRATRNDRLGVLGTRPPRCFSGGGGLVSSAADYQRFVQMLSGRGALDGVRVLGPRTLDLMTANQLPGHADLESFGGAGLISTETTYDGVGFGLGFSVVEDPIAARYPASRGEFAWGGAASTAFWVDPVERMTVLFLTQLLPSSTHPLRSQLHQLTHQALID
jgi:CubicO group peptidase (beta-lactamase class C family)